MKRFTSLMLMLLMAVTTFAAVDEELRSKKVSAVGEAATSIDTDTWYLLYNCGRRLYVSEETTSFLMRATNKFTVGAHAAVKAGYLFKFEATGNTNEYYIKSGNGLYFSITQGSSTVSATPVAYTIAQIGDNAGHFYGQMVSDNRVLNGNGENGTLAGWNTDIPTGTGNNSDYQFLPVTLEDNVVDYTALDNAVSAANSVLTNAGYTISVTDAVTLQIDNAEAAGYLTVSHPACDEDVLANAIDSNPSTLYHSNWQAGHATPYMQVDLGEEGSLDAFVLNYTTRQSGNNGAPYAITVTGSTDGTNFAYITNLSKSDIVNAIPATNGQNYSALFIADKAYRYLRFTVTSSPNGNNSFGVAEFGIQKAIVTGEKNGTTMRYATIYNAIASANLIKEYEYATTLDVESVAADLNAFVELATQECPFELTTDVEAPVCYLIKSAREAQGWTNPYWTFSTPGIAITEYADEVEDDINAYWFFMEDNKTGLISIYPYANRTNAIGYSALSEGADKLTNAATAIGDSYQLVVTETGTFSAYPYALTPFKSNIYVSNHSGRGNKLGFYSGLEDGGTRFELIKANPTENPNLKENIVINWTPETEWVAVEAVNYPSKVFNDNALTSTDNSYTPFVGYVEGEFSIATSTMITATFDYSTGNCALNMRGVEVVDANGNVVAADYHVGKAGTPPATANVYTVNVAEAGTYKVRCYAAFDGKNRANATTGTITIAFAKEETSTFSHNVTFAAEYATLYLGYKVAVPAGVEAYVVSNVEDWAILAPVTGVIPAATPVILKKTGEDVTYTFAYTEGEAANVETNLLRGSIADRYVSDNAYVLGQIGGVVGLYRAEKNQLDGSAWLNNANKAYLPAVAGSANVASYSFRFGEGTTGLDEVKGENGNVKGIYDLTGRRVEAITAPGIYVVNGKKVLVK